MDEMTIPIVKTTTKTTKTTTTTINDGQHKKHIYQPFISNLLTGYDTHE